MRPTTDVKLSRLTAALLLLPVLTTAGASQTSATASVTAAAAVTNLRSVSLTAVGVHDLEFGTVTRGIFQAPPSATDCGRFNVVGEGNAPVSITFILPTVLTSTTGETALIEFGPTDGLIWTGFPTANVRFDPRATFLGTLDGFGLLVVGILGSVRPTEFASPGSYSGTITMLVSY